ncbi:hypothetical protein SAICODRAFT_4962 [Saitoella complicata NRRL Y-17804]|uniref:Cyclin-D1-binding protein 1-like N-terminal domain-containing protein n=1 Tax=Saitoella complicata (strain BCRC 22490 / CBS 7301 / JCM 7358 / NBRC 10748 / NRRL Y-17804) TaxID=698492 RepID=A0A0E9N8X2_SAICN|nr:uncharacterized protein SAICODRAFT_4962 [Saitoella complicata NRRL Y-17804]ODQ55736.1 hypothetical protein SAICODRAFT_4962 [Saitoella complicata NRRL Y-17804]GAO46151.1 hypothetical protein G7K_0389-t1 [Saitoella complicata NRRL Y-17804]
MAPAKKIIKKPSSTEPAPDSAFLKALRDFTSHVSYHRFSLSSAVPDAIAATISSSADAAPPLKALSDLGALVHSRATNFSLACRPPITVDAAKKSLEELSGLVGPLAAAVYCTLPEKHGRSLYETAQQNVSLVFSGMEALASELIPADESSQRGRLASTGVLWEACNDLTALNNLGLHGIVQKKVEGYKSMLQDAIEDLEGWIENGGDDEDEDWDDAFGDNDSETEDSGDEEGGGKELDPASEAQIEYAKATVRRLKTISALYARLNASRLKPTPSLTPAPEDIASIDTIADLAKQLSVETDELVCKIQERALQAEVSALDKEICEKARELMEVGRVKEKESEDVRKWWEEVEARLK